MNRRLISLFLFFSLCVCFIKGQTLIDSISRIPPLRGDFRWKISEEMYEEGKIQDNIKSGVWIKYFKGKVSGKNFYKQGLAISEHWNFRDTMRVRYTLSDAYDTLITYDYDMEGRLNRITKSLIDIKTAFLNYSLLTEDTVFKKSVVTTIDYSYVVWKHRKDVLLVSENTGGILNKKYFRFENRKWMLWFEINDKGDFLSGKKKEFLKEEEKSKESELKKTS